MLENKADHTSQRQEDQMRVPRVSDGPYSEPASTGTTVGARGGSSSLFHGHGTRSRGPVPRSRTFIIRILIVSQVVFMSVMWYRPLLPLQGSGHQITAGPRPVYRPLSMLTRGASGRRRTTGSGDGSGGDGGGLEDLGVRLAAPSPPASAMTTASEEANRDRGSTIPVAGMSSTVESFRPVSLDASKWLFFVRIQKTGSETLWKSLLQNLDGRVWGRSRACPNGFFCGYQCQATVESFMEAYDDGQERCKLLVRGHIGVYDYEQAAVSRGVDREDLVLFTMLRDPIKRVISEYIHVTRNLPSQFGHKAYGRAWDYNYTGPADDITAFLECQACQVGVSNRQTRMLAGMFTTGDNDPTAQQEGGEAMLNRALANLERMSFVGVMERYQDSMLMLKRTFPEQLKDFRRYAYSKHPHDGSSGKVALTEEQLDRIKSLNRLDVALYQRAMELFQARWRDMRFSSSTMQGEEERFVAVGGGGNYVLKAVERKGEEDEEWTRPVDDYGVIKMRGQGGADDDDSDDDQASPSRSTQSSGVLSRGDLSSSKHRREHGAGGPKTIREYENFHDVITTTDIPRCKPSRVASSSDFAQQLPPHNQGDANSRSIYDISGSILAKYKSVSMSTVRQLCLSLKACEGYIFHAQNRTATLFAQASDTSTSSTVQVLREEEEVYVRTGLWGDDPLEPLLDRYKRTHLLQLASSRDTQFDAYGDSNSALRCRLPLPGPLPPTGDDGFGPRYEVYEPVNGISHYEIIAKLDYVGPWRAMQICAAREDCVAFSLVVRDGHAYLLKIAGAVANLRMREPYGNGGDGTFRLYVKMPGKDKVPSVISESDIKLSEYAFMPFADTKLPQIPPTPRPVGVVVSLTTIPSRVHQLEDTLLSLVQQTMPPDQIIVAMPTISKREGGRPYVIPDWLRAMHDTVQLLEVEEDHGPATKLIPTLQHLKKQAANHLVIVVDDDTHYPPRLVETLVRWHEVLPNMALSFRGWAVHEAITYLPFSDSFIVFGNDIMAPHPVSVLTANCGYMVQTAFFDADELADFSNAPDGARWMDDVWISGQLAKRGLPRLVVPFDEHQNTYNSYFPGLTLDTIRVRNDVRSAQQNGGGGGRRATNPREAANNQALGYFHGDWDVLWKDGYRIYSEVLGIPQVRPRLTSTFRGIHRRVAIAGRAYEDEGPVTGPKKGRGTKKKGG